MRFMSHGDGEMTLKPRNRRDGRLIERITLCVDTEMKDAWDRMMREYDVAESVREHIRRICGSAKSSKAKAS